MTVLRVKNALRGVYFNEEATADADIQDLFLDDVFTQTCVVDSAAGTDFTYLSIKVPFAIQIVSATVCPGGALTAADAT